uniref:EF-hand domain-containing protein n=1 Tax=Macrostomum lignano TaxID=282301 RepID=A0A1I8H1P3_9PLAT
MAAAGNATAAADKSMTYEVQGQKYVLPPPSLTKPLNSGAEASGLLDTWPAHASCHTVPDSQVLLTKDSRLVVIDDESAGRPNLLPKPKFLEQLEGYLKRELKSHNVTEVAASTIRLQIHREVFEYLIEAFQNLQAVVGGDQARVRDDDRSSARRDPPTGAHEGDAVDAESGVRPEDHGNPGEEKDEMRQLRSLNLGLREKIDKMHEQQHDLEQQVETLKAELTDMQQRYRDEADSRKLLVADMNELRSQQEDMSIFKKAADSEDSGEDPVQLRIGLNQAKKSQADLIDRITRMEADYSDVVPRRQFETVSAQFASMEEEYGNYKRDTDKLIDEHRPEWERCGEYISGGADRWKELSQGKRSDELVDIILQEMSGLTTGEAQMLEGLGYDEKVPKFLQHGTPVNNRRMTKRDARIHIREIWDARKREKDEQVAAYETGDAKPLTPMGDFVDSLFRQIYGIEQIRVEWAYSFYDALQRYAQDERCQQFFSVLMGTMSEEVYWDDMRTLGRLLDAFKTKDPSGSGLLDKTEFAEVMREFFPGRNDDKFQELTDVAAQELDTDGSAKLEFDKLFMTDDEGEFGAFLKDVKKLLHDEKEKYIAEMRKELVDISADKLTPDDCIRAFGIVDPSLDPTKQEEYLRWIFNVPNKEEDYRKAGPLDIDTVCDRMLNGPIKRMGKRL